METKRIIVGMSGGVDSSVAALILRREGHHVSGMFMRNWDHEDPDTPCPAKQDALDALSVCDHLDIELDAVNFTQAYWDRVFNYFLDELKKGRTPNPDILCNKEIKFKAFLEHALAQGAEKIATGHYARVEEKNGQFYLLKAKDHNKDQSYFLHAISQHALANSVFPLGQLEKPQVRKLAEEAGLSTFAKKDSTGICFIGERQFNTFLKRYLPNQPGEIRALDGTVVGQHQGLMYYTLGQRKGIGIGGTQSGSGQPWFVVEKDLERNVLWVVQGDHERLYSSRLDASDLNWINGAPPAKTFECTAKTRYRQPDQACRADVNEDGSLQLAFAERQRSVTPGQSVVLYAGDTCLGGGIINETYRD